MKIIAVILGVVVIWRLVEVVKRVKKKCEESNGSV